MNDKIEQRLTTFEQDFHSSLPFIEPETTIALVVFSVPDLIDAIRGILGIFEETINEIERKVRANGTHDFSTIAEQNLIEKVTKSIAERLAVKR